MDGVAHAGVSEQATDARRRGRLARRPLAPALAVGAGVAALYALWSWRQWQRFETPSWDLGIFTQLFRAYGELRAPVVPIKGPGFMLLGDHWHPLLAVLTPAWWVHPSGLTLLVVQALLVGASAAVVTGCAARHLGRWPGVGVGVAYGLSWGLQSAVASQFHEVALALPFLAASLAALVRRDHRAAALWSLPLLGIKEDLGLTVTMIGVVIAIRGSRRLGALLAAGGVAAFVVTTRLLLPALNPDGVWDYAEDSIVSQVLSDPGAAIDGLLTGAPQKLLLVLLVVAVTGFLALGSPLVLVTLPTFAWRLTSDVPFHWSTDWHYSAVLMPVVFLAMVDTLLRSPAWKARAPLMAGAAVVVALALVPQFPLWRLVDGDYWRPGVRPAGASAALAAVPDGATVVSDITLMAYLAPRTEVYWMGNENPVPDYVVLYQGAGIYGGEPPESAEGWAEARFPGEDFTQVLAVDGFLVARHTP
ncbi:MAG TPA: DUF2079 domain-containing protein [Actinotalea caeni]|uniref:DUF2079 domain-containing protein n=1 Tax=Actinotalea caeni TaxID=1348467 RepID=UPI0012E2866D|nr:DUF2079 domain-containing protein [Actinotalea caeni]HLV57103.1 DUF2079 domain-containing protein [Actinotalea caeni]